MLTFDISGAQIEGARDYQEDAFLITHLGDTEHESGSLVIVADGMGGHAAGNVASNMAVQTFNKHITSNFPSDRMDEVLRESVYQANSSIAETVHETAALKGMGCTLVAIVLAGEHVNWVSVGDSHLYLIRNGEITKKNADHSYGGFLDRMEAEGTPVEPETGFSRNMLMSALTGEEIADIDCPTSPMKLEAGDRIIVATDGLDTLSESKVMAFSDESETPKACVDALLASVDEAKIPRQDNTTIVIIDVAEKKESTSPSSSQAVDTPSVTPVSVTPAPRPFAIEEEPRETISRGNRIAKVLGILVLIAAIGAAAYWYFDQKSTGDTARITDLADIELDEPEEEILDLEDDSTTTPEDVPPPGDEPDGETETITSDPEQTAIVRGERFTDKLRVGGAGPGMIWIQGGSFTMGSHIGAAKFDERPEHLVTIERFAISEYEVSIAEYDKFARATNRRRPKTGALDATTYPVFFISWNDAVAYAKWLSTQTGASYRLPTEAEWEYAARAGSTTSYWWGRKLGTDNAHCFACGTGLDPRQPTKRGRFAANPFGVYDTAGNVEEWVADCYNKDYQGAPKNGSVFEGGDCSVRVVRGGAYSSGPKALRSSARGTFRFDKGNDSIGIRIVRD